MISAVPIDRRLMEHLVKGSAEDPAAPGRWIPMRACLYLALCGELRWSELHRITRGLDVQGKRLVEDAGKPDDGNAHPMGVSYNFKAPRSWIARWASADSEKRKAMEAAFNRAVENTVRDYVEPEIARCRLKDGTEAPASILAARVNHVVNSEGNMRYHAHVLFPFPAVSPNGQIRPLILSGFSDRRLDAGAYFNLALEYESVKIGIHFYQPMEIDGRSKNQVEAKDVPHHIGRDFSKPPIHVTGQLQVEAVPVAAEPAATVVPTSRHGQSIPTQSTLFHMRQQKALQKDPSLDWASGLPSTQEFRKPSYGWIFYNAVAQCSERGASFQRKDVFREAFRFAQGQGGVSPFYIYTCLKRDLQRPSIFIDQGLHNNTQWYTVAWVQDLTMDLAGCVIDLHTLSSFKPLPENIVQKVLDKNRCIHSAQAVTETCKLSDAHSADRRPPLLMDDEQVACIRYATQSHGKIKPIYGMDENTKVTLASAIAEAYRTAGYKTLGLSPSDMTADKFSKQTGIESDTISNALSHACCATGHEPKHLIRQSRPAAHGLNNVQSNRLALDKDTVLFVDQASNVTLSQYAFLTDLCCRSATTMILLGDQRRLPAVDRVAPFSLILDSIGGFELKTVKRQRLDQEQDPVKPLSRSQIEPVSEPGLTDNRSPLLKQVEKPGAKPHGERHKKKRDLTVKLEPEY